MRTIELVYEYTPKEPFSGKPMTDICGDQIRELRSVTTSNGKEYERIVNVIHEHPDQYRVISVRHI